MKPRTAALIAIALTLLLYWLWRVASEGARGTNRVPVRPAPVSVSFENYLDEMDDEQRGWEGLP